MIFSYKMSSPRKSPRNSPSARKSPRSSPSLRKSPRSSPSARKSPRKGLPKPNLPRRSSPSSEDMYYIPQQDVHFKPKNVDNLVEMYFQNEGRRRPTDYIQHSTLKGEEKVTSRMRQQLINWLRGVTIRFRLTKDTFFLAVDIIDRFMSLKTVSKAKFQLLGATALLIAAKYEEVSPFFVDDIVYISGGNIKSGDDVRIMEQRQILPTLNWELTVPTSYLFLTALNNLDKHLNREVMKKREDILVNVSMMYELNINYKPSLIASASIYFSNLLLGLKPAWNKTIERRTGYSISVLNDFAKEYNRLMAKYPKAKYFDKSLFLPSSSETMRNSPRKRSSPKRKSPASVPRRISPRTPRKRSSPKRSSPKSASISRSLRK